jgi:hypothetical protein
VSAYFAWPYIVRAPEPDAEVLSAALGPRLPPFVQLQNVSVHNTQQVESAPVPTYNVRFAGNGVLTSTVYLRGTADGDIVFLSEPANAGVQLPLSGAAVIKWVDDTWSTELSLEQHPVFGGVTPQSFPDKRVIVQGSPEEAAFLAEAHRAREAQRQQELMAATLAEQQRAAEGARQELQRLAQAAAAERARAAEEQARTAEQARVAALAERNRIEAQQRADAQAAAVAAAEAQRRQGEARLREEQEAARAITPGRIPRNTQVTVQITSRLRSDQVKVEDRFDTVTTEDIVVNGRVLVPAGSTLRAIVSRVQPATHVSRTALVELSFDQLTVGRQSFPLRARAPRITTSMKGEAAKIGVAAGIGAVIGGLLGGAEGAAIGAGVGGGGTIAATEGREVDLPPGSTLRVKLDAPVDIQ